MIVIYSGMAQAGKTTRVNPTLRKLGFTVMSTSILLDKFTSKTLMSLVNTKFNPEKRDLMYYFTMNHPVGEHGTLYFQGDLMSRRELKIRLAEEVLVPLFSRTIFAHRVAQQAIDSVKEGRKVAIESVGGEELDLMLTYLFKFHGKLKMFNVKGSEQLPAGTDLRKLIPGVPMFDTDDVDRLRLDLQDYLLGE